MTNEQAIKNIIAFMYYSEDIPEDVGKAFDIAIAALKQGTANRGKWKHKDGIKYYFCNICGSGNNNGGGIKTKFCPNCGARMEMGATNE